MKAELTQISLTGWICLAILLFTQSLWLFKDAQKQKVNPWFWGIWGLLNCPTPLVVYWLIVRKAFRKKKSKG